MILKLAITSFIVFGPAALANVAPIFANKITWLRRLNIPIDAGKSFRGKRIFGDNKTIRGFAAGYVFALVGVFIQRRLMGFNSEFYSNQLLTISPLLLALLYDLGALGGDAVESFFKRQSNHAPGTAWFPFDQLDFVIGTLIATWPVVHYSGQLAIMTVVVLFVLHIVSSPIGYLLHLKSSPI